MSLTSGKQDIFPVGHSCCGRGVISDLVNLLHVDNINSGKGLSGLRSNQTFFVHSISLKKMARNIPQGCIKTLYSSFPYNSNGRRPLRLTFFYAAPAAAIITAPTWDPCRLPIAKIMSRE